MAIMGSIDVISGVVSDVTNDVTLGFIEVTSLEFIEVKTLEFMGKQKLGVIRQI